MTATFLGPFSHGPVDLKIDGDLYTAHVPADGRSALEAVLAGKWTDIIPGWLDEPSKDRLYERLADPRSRMDLFACTVVALGLVEEITGRPWNQALMIAATIAEYWVHFEPWCVLKGFDVEGMPAHRIVSAGVAWLYEGCEDDKDRAKIDRKLERPPSLPADVRARIDHALGVKKKQQKSAENFFAQLGQFGSS